MTPPADGTKTIEVLQLEIDSLRRELDGLKKEISSHKQLRKELEAALFAAQEADRAKSDFVAMASHELRTPMNGIMGMTELLLATQLTDSQRDDVSLIKSSVESLLDIVNDILDLSKVSAGKLELTRKRIDVRSCINGAIQPLIARASEKNLRLSTSIDPKVPKTLIGDAGRLRQVVVNLVGNAIKFTSRGEISVEVISNRLTDKHEELTVRVSDTGAGIAPNKLRALFEPFVQAGSAPSPGGTGLGLAICRKLVRLMGGEIEVRSELGVGSTFSFTIRLEHEHMYSSGEMPSVTVAKPDAPPTSQAPKYRVLVAEDNKVNQHFVIRMLEKKGHSVVLAESGRHAVSLFESTHFDVVLMDVQMPDMDGFTATQAIRKIEQLRGSHTPIIAMTAHAMSGDRERCLESGMDGYVSKPIRFDELFHLVDHLATECAATVKNEPAETPQPPQLDLERLLKHVDGDADLLKQMAKIFLDSTPKLRLRIQSAVENRDAIALEHVGHALKGAAGNFLALDTMRAAGKLEELGRSRHIEQAGLILIELERALDALTIEVRKLAE